MKKKILFTIPNFDTAGSGKALLNIARGLDQGTFEPCIVCSREGGDFFTTVRASRIPVYIFRYISPLRPIGSLLRNTWETSRLLKQINPHLIHSFHYNSDYSEPLSAKMAGIPWVFTKKNMSWGGSSQNSWKLRTTLANGIVIQNKDMRERFYKNSNKVVQIPRGVDTSSFQPARPKPHIRKKMGTPANRRVILSVANMLPVKGLELLTEAFYKLPHHHHQWTLWLVGEYNNAYGKKILDWVHRHDMENIIRFSGKITDVKAYLDHGELFVLPTKDEGRIEGTPVAMLEAMANGKVVVGSEVAGIKDQLKGCPEHLFEPGNVESLKNKLDEFMQNSPETNRNIGQQFINRVKDRLSLEQEIQRHESFYHRIIKTSAKTPVFPINSGI